jgi:shikimate kinase
MKNIVLIGMPGCGKSTIGKLIAKKIKLDFCDVDTFIESTEGKSIPEIFKNGEDAFRRIEASATKEVSLRENLVISTGGGVIKKYENIENLKRNGVIVFIDRDIEDILRDVEDENRPLLKNNKSHLYNLYEERYSLYKKYCDIQIKNNKDIELVTTEIINKIKNLI